MTGLHLVMPMAGRGSRFTKAGFDLPKPLLRLYNEPFFWWAAESVRRCVEIRSLTFVVLAEHVRQHRIDHAVRDRFPGAQVVALNEPTSGALVTAIAGCQTIPGDGPVIVNDCDHAFSADWLTEMAEADSDGFLCHFRSQDAAYSYAEYDDAGRLVRTVEKQVVSELAIAGAYGFRDRDTFLRHAAIYEQDCPYDEPFMSGVYNTIITAGGTVHGGVLDRHVSFGTPAEYELAPDAMQDFRSWPLVAAQG